jgi:hypothetical protein
MSTESKEKKESAACCDPKEFKGMSEMMKKCCSGQSRFNDCSAMMETMKNQSCCSPTIEKATTDSDKSKENSCC